MTAEQFKPGPGWGDKTGFAPGVPDDPAQAPVTMYQVLHGRVFTLMRCPDESASRGEIALAELERRVGGPVKEGWYDALGEYLGAVPPDGL